MNTKALRQKILDLAIRGKLVPQDPHDEPASVLLERIRDEKLQMVKDGRLKPKDIKNDTIIFKGEDNLHYEQFADGTVKCIEDEIPFEVPDGWEWARLNTLGVFAGGKTPSTGNGDFWDGNVLWTTSKDMKSKYISDTIIKMSSLGAEQMQIFLPGTILMVVRSGILRRTFPVAILKKASTVNQDIKALTPYILNLCEYLYCFFKANEDGILLKCAKSGTTVESINIEYVKNLLVPLPSLTEQTRIINTFSTADSHTDMIESGESDLQSLIAQMKSKILDLAIRGQLVPQDPNDEPASALVERIRAEKEKLIKEGKIKRDKKESFIFKGEDNSYYRRTGKEVEDISSDLPFGIPDSWVWEQLGNLCAVNPRNNLPDNIVTSFIPMSMIEDGFSGKHSSESHPWKEIKSGFTHFQNGDIGIAKITPCFENRKSTVFHNLIGGYGAGTTELYILRSYNSEIIPEYLLALVKGERFISHGKQSFTGAVGQQRIGKDYVTNTFCPFPPVEEQKRIVEAISAYFAQLDRITDALV